MTNIAARLAEAAATYSEAIAVELIRADGVESTTFGALAERAGRVAGWLKAHGISTGDRVALLADNDAGWIAAYLGVMRLGAVAVPLDTAYKAAQVRTVLESSGARVLLTSPRYLDVARAATAAAVATAPEVLLLAGRADDAESFDAVTPGAMPPIADVSADAPAVILYTSGTTADPKGVVLTHANLDAERAGVFSVIDVSEKDAVLGVLPLFHALAQVANLLLPLAAGTRIVFLETVSSTSLIQALQDRGISILACVPQFFYLIHQRVMSEVARRSWLSRVIFRALLATNGWLRDHGGWNPGRRWFARVHRVLGPKMRILVTGGSAFDPTVSRGLYSLGFTLLNAYGLTETSGGATIVRPADRFTTSVGQPLTGVEIRIGGRVSPVENSGDIREAESQEFSTGETRPPGDGEILIRGPIVMREYFNRPDATGDALCDGWLRTGDLGRLDAQGRLYITGRLKEIIVLSSGKNLYPEEIEAAYRQSTFIKELCVLGLSRPDEPTAERLHAVIVPDDQTLRERGIVNLRELLRFEIETVSVSLPPHKRILSYDIWLEPLPRTTTGKIKRHDIERRVRERGETGASAAARPLTDAEQIWLAKADHAAAVEAIAARVAVSVLRPDANLELDLGLDSMERVELLTMLEQRRGTRVPPDARATIFTVRQLVDAVAAAPSAGEPIDAAARDQLPWDTLLASEPDAGIIANLKRPKRLRIAGYIVILKAMNVVGRLVLRLRTTGREHLPANGPFILSPNHQTFLDGFVLAAVLPVRLVPQLFFVGDAGLFEGRLMRWLGDSINVVPVDPDANLVNAMRAGAAGLRLNRVLVLFPEGERTIDGEVKRFRKGAAILASHLEVPVVPVALDGLYPLWPRGRPFNWRHLLPWRVEPVTVSFGPPLSVPRGAYVEGTAATRNAVIGLLNRDRARPARAI